MEVEKKLLFIQKNLFVPKGQRNEFGKYNYRSCEDILKTVKPIAAEKNCLLTLDSGIQVVGDRIYVVSVAKLTDLDSGESITNSAMAREEETKKGMDGSQITGAAISYARKYALAGLFAIDNEKDSDATNDSKEDAPKETSIEEKITDLMFNTIVNLADEKGIDHKTICDRYGVSTIKDIPAKCYTGLMNGLKKS